MELQCLWIFGVVLAQLFHTGDEELKLLKEHLEDLYVLVVHWLVQQIVQAETASNHEHQTLVKLGCDVEEDLIVVVKLQLVVLNVIDHARLLLVEKLPNFEDILEVLSRNLVEVSLQRAEFLLVLLLQDLEIEI
jgi:hypothetical protein